MRHIAGNAYEAQKYGALAGNLTRVSSLPKMRSATELRGLELRRGLEPRSLIYETRYTKPVRRHLRLRSMERDAVIETAPQPWQGCVLPLNQSRVNRYEVFKEQKQNGRGGETRTHVSLIPNQVG